MIHRRTSSNHRTWRNLFIVTSGPERDMMGAVNQILCLLILFNEPEQDTVVVVNQTWLFFVLSEPAGTQWLLSIKCNKCSYFNYCISLPWNLETTEMYPPYCGTLSCPSVYKPGPSGPRHFGLIGSPASVSLIGFCPGWAAPLALLKFCKTPWSATVLHKTGTGWAGLWLSSLPHLYWCVCNKHCKPIHSSVIIICLDNSDPTQCVKPILLYGSQVWGYSNIEQIKVFHQCLKES